MDERKGKFFTSFVLFFLCCFPFLNKKLFERDGARILLMYTFMSPCLSILTPTLLFDYLITFRAKSQNCTFQCKSLSVREMEIKAKYLHN